MTLKRFMRTGLWLAGIGLAAGVVMLNVLAYSHTYGGTKLRVF